MSVKYCLEGAISCLSSAEFKLKDHPLSNDIRRIIDNIEGVKEDYGKEKN